ncbi:Chemotaxis regulator - transmits chemoreceptor signals to flagellar motor components CheY [hydrothermal vent metagenome]|uniref:Chemotaxis regulator - transmits chemoreceptor signals to flagellar motor components CheY n=1 Tax=hydrothermal vent metagenome TaxID=652676 RepID=A0A3B0WPI2_9ZZZZ
MSKTIMVVDDSSSIRQVISIALKGAGYEVIEACDGKDALSKLTGQKIHLIVSDVNMPNLDGIGLVKEVKQHPQYKFTPIMMLTTESGETKKQEGKSAGAKGWLVKPFQPTALLSAVAKLA